MIWRPLALRYYINYTPMKTNIEPVPVLAIGIDVSKADLHIALDKNNRSKAIIRIKNSELTIKKFITEYTGNYSGKIIMESTGDYHILSAVLFSEAGLDVRVINPLLSSRYAQGNIRKTKTDKADAWLLAKIALIEPNLPPRFNCSRSEVNYRKKMKLLDTLSDQITRLQVALKNYETTLGQLGINLSPAETELRGTIKLLKKQKERLLKELGQTTEINQDKILDQQRLTDIPGIASHTAAAVITIMSHGPATTAKQWIAYMGLDISVRESGQWKGRCKLTKRGNSVLRRWIYASAWGAVMTNEKFKEYYNYLKQQGRHHFECLLIVARKLLRIMFNLLKTKTSFNPALPLFEIAT